MPGPGKGLAVEVAHELGVPVVSMGDLVRREATARGLPDIPASYGQVASELRGSQGPDVWAVRTLVELKTIEAPTVLIDGIRNLQEVERFRGALGHDLLLVAFLASPATRYARMLGRGRGEDADDEDALRERDLRELGYGLGGPIAMADVYVDNEGSADEARELLRGVLGA